MSVSHEIKSQLARLLATEDLVVEHRKVETACFNVHTRILTLPMWKTSEEVYEMLISHEVAHALYTPDEDWTLKVEIPGQFVNIVEDIRVEKKMKQRYPGLSKTFFVGYKQLSDEDFFDVKDQDTNQMNLADKINLFFKIGNFEKISFSEKEKEVVNIVSSCETFDDVLNASEILYKYCKENMNDNEDNPEEDIPEEDIPNNQGYSGEMESEKQSNKSNSSSQSESNNDSVESEDKEESEESGDEEESKSNDPKVNTADNLEEKLQKMAEMSGFENDYIEYPKFDIDKIIVDNKKIHDDCKEVFSEVSSENPYFETCYQKFEEFKTKSRKEVNYLVKEFECRKSAQSYARASVSRTGIIDCSKLHTYKYNEDLFKKVTSIPDGKNHGLVFVLDWSGSMCEVMMDTLKQLYQLLLFCQKVNIPFDVYAFTNSYPNEKLIHTTDDYGLRCFPHEKREYVIHLDETFSMMHLFTSGVTSKVLNEQMKNIWACAYSFNHYGITIPGGMGLSGTPLNEALVTLTEIIPAFQKKHSLEKVNCVILTDGEAHDLRYFKKYKDWNGNMVMRSNFPTEHTHFRDRKTGKTYKFNSGYSIWFDVLTRNLKDRMPNVNFIGFRIVSSGDLQRFIQTYAWEQKAKLTSEWKKNRCFTIKDCGYQKYFGLSATSLANEKEFEVENDATKSEIKNAFIKSLRYKKMNKKILNEFVELIV